MALCNVLQFFVNTGDKRLSSIIVKGERIFQPDEGNSREEEKRANENMPACFPGEKAFHFPLTRRLCLEVE